MPYNSVLIPALIIGTLIMRVGIQTDVIVLVHADAADIFLLVIVIYIIGTFFTTNIHIYSSIHPVIEVSHRSGMILGLPSSSESESFFSGCGAGPADA